MGSNKEAQAARNAADRRLREAHPTEFTILMEEEYAKRGLTWKRRGTAEERAAQKAEAKKQAVVTRLRAEAAKAGIGILLVEDPDIQEKMDSAADGTFKGVTLDWRGDENGFADEQADVRAALADTDDENYQSRETAPVTE